MVTIHGLEFTDNLLEKIRDTLTGEPDISRRQLSYRICEWANWRSHNGRLKDMTCRKALLELNRREIIKLPESSKEYAFQKRLERDRKSVV